MFRLDLPESFGYLGNIIAQAGLFIYIFKAQITAQSYNDQEYQRQKGLNDFSYQ